MKSQSRLRLVVPTHGFDQWNGGVDFINYVHRALKTAALECQAEVTMAHSSPALSARIRSSLRLAYSTAVRAVSGSKGRRFVTPTQSRNSIPVRDVRRYCERTDSTAFCSFFPLKHTSQPWVGYLFDFQHRRLRALFSDRQWHNRERSIRLMVSAAPALVVNSRSVVNDLAAFCGDQILPPVLALPFTPFVHRLAFSADASETTKKHGLAAPYFIVCNHMWVHKDHATALRSFARYRELSGDRDTLLVFTGDTFDFRDSSHFRNLTRLARHLGVAGQLRVLGLIPKADQLALLRGAVALIQPTLCEGGPGGGSVFEAAGLGVQSIVSDIAVNLEIEHSTVRFFSAGNPESLAQQMRQAISSPAQFFDEELLIERSEQALFHLGKTMLDFAEATRMRAAALLRN